MLKRIFCLSIVFVLISGCTLPGVTAEVTPTLENTPAVPVNGPTPTAADTEDWLTYTNEYYGYQISYPPYATVREDGVGYVETREIPADTTFDEYTATIEAEIGDNFCVYVIYLWGWVSINAPTNQSYRYTHCGPTGQGVGTNTALEETLTVKGQSYIADGFEWQDENGGDTLNKHLQVFRIDLPDGFQIMFGSGYHPEVTYAEYLETTKPILEQIILTYDDSLEATYDYGNYAQPTLRTGLDAATFGGDVTVPDGTVFAPGETFTKTWRLTNSGETAWSSAYALVFEEGDSMGADLETTHALTRLVEPGDAVNVSVELTAPEEPGSYIGYWMLVNERGERFGLGEDHSQAFFVMIQVAADGGADDTEGDDINETDTDEEADETVEGGAAITAASLSVSPSSYAGECPVTLEFNGSITSGAGDYVYEVEAGAGSSGFQFFLPEPQDVRYLSGENTLPVNFVLQIENSVDGWAQLVANGGNTLRSNQATFSVTCE
ncbi:MAG: hypothetical protein JXB38_19125 [Anaerolineales bacterium]|nr:hypothetical protein [Anaerolineales bacterium]